MARLSWSERDYESGLDRGVFYPFEGSAEAWNGLISVVERPSDISQRVRYLDGRKIVNKRRDESFSATISTYFTPPSFSFRSCRPFGMSYRVGTNKGYKIHLVYNAFSLSPAPTHRQREVSPLTFDILTRPIAIPEYSPSAHLVVDAAQAYPEALVEFESLLYGTDSTDPRLPQPTEVFDIFEDNALYKVIDNGDGTFTLEAPDEAIEWLSATEFEADWPKVVYLSEDTYQIRSW